MFKIYSVPNYTDKYNSKTSPNPDKIFMSGEIEEIAEELEANDKNYHFLIKNTENLILFGDIDGLVEANLEIDEVLIDLAKFLKERLSIKVKDTDFCVTTNVGEKKRFSSYHWTLPTYNCKVSLMKELISTFINESDKKYSKKEIDLSVYSGASWFRCPNQTKGEKYIYPKENETPIEEIERIRKNKESNSMENRGKHMIERGEMIDHIPSYVSEESVNIDKKISKLLNSISEVEEKKEMPNDEKKKKNDKKKEEDIENFQKFNKLDVNIDQELTVIKDLIEILSPTRASKGHYDDWLNVCFALKNSLGEYGRELFHMFSKKDMKEYSKRECDEKYDKITTDVKRKQLTIASIYYWAKEDDQEKFKIILQTKSIQKNETLTDYAAACLLKIFMKEDIVWSNGCLYVFNGIHWLKDSTTYGKASNHIKHVLMTTVYDFLVNNLGSFLAIDTMDVMKRRKQSLNRLRTHKFTLEVIKVSQLLFENNDIKFDNNPDILPFKNKIYDLRNSSWIEHEKSLFISQYIEYDWNSPLDEDLKTLEKMINQILPNTEERKFYLTYLSSGLDGYRYPNLVICKGKGRNGKGVINSLMHTTLDIFAYKADTALLTSKKSTGPCPELANMHDKRFVYFQELDGTDGVTINTAFLKDLTGSDKFTARGLHEKDTEKTARFTFVGETNDLLKFGKVNTALLSRVFYVDFKSTFTLHEDNVDEEMNIYLANPYYDTPEFREKYKFAMMQILINNYEDHSKNNRMFKIPQSIIDKTISKMDLSDEVRTWFKDHVYKTDSNEDIIKVKDLYDLFKESEYFENLTKVEKRQKTITKFTEEVEDLFKPSKNNMYGFYERKKIEGKDYSRILFGYKKLTENQSEECDSDQECKNIQKPKKIISFFN